MKDPGIQYQPIPRPPGTWTLTLNRYHRDNLLWLLTALGYGMKGIEPFTFAHTGDWVGEIVLMLGKTTAWNTTMGNKDVSFLIDEGDSPNNSYENLRRQVDWWIAQKVKEASVDQGKTDS